MDHPSEHELEARSESPMPALEEYDVLVLGSGEAGKYIAWTCAKNGMRTAVIERKYVGGSCPNIACLPSKNVIQSAKIASYFRRSEEFGITKENTRINMAVVRDRKRKMVDGLVDMHLANFKASGTELVSGFGRFIGPKTIEVAGFTALGVGAGDIIATVQVAMLAGLPYTVLRDAIFAHPSMPEGLIPLFSTVPPISRSSESPA